MRFSFMYPSKKYFSKFDKLLSAISKATMERFNKHSSGGDCSWFVSKLRVDMLRRLQNAPASICSKPIADSPRSCKVQVENVIYHTLGSN